MAPSAAAAATATAFREFTWAIERRKKREDMGSLGAPTRPPSIWKIEKLDQLTLTLRHPRVLTFDLVSQSTQTTQGGEHLCVIAAVAGHLGGVQVALGAQTLQSRMSGMSWLLAASGHRQVVQR